MADEEPTRVAAHDETVEWASVRAGAIAAFNGEQPHDGTEVAVIDVFKTFPEEVIAEINAVGQLLTDGVIRSGWGVLRKRVGNIEAQARRRTASATIGPNRDKAHARACQYMRAAGLFLASHAEVIDEMFGERGQLQAFPEFQGEMLQLWDSLQVKRRETEEAAVARGLAYRAKRVLDSGGKTGSTIPREAQVAEPFANLTYPGTSEPAV